jgi:hypothetical protein
MACSPVVRETLVAHVGVSVVLCNSKNKKNKRQTQATDLVSNDLKIGNARIIFIKVAVSRCSHILYTPSGLVNEVVLKNV